MRFVLMACTVVLLVLSADVDNLYGGTLRLAHTMDIETLDPHRTNIFYEDFDSSISACNQIYEGLVCYKSGTAEIDPLLAESWDISENGLVYTFHLRKNVYWHDGNDIFAEGKSRTVTAEDVEYSWNRVTDPDTLSPMKDFFVNNARIESWTLKGAHTFEVTLSQPNPSFLYMLPFPCFLIIPQEMERFKIEEFSSHAVGSGPFKVKQVNPLVLEYNEDYWKGEPYLSEIEYKLVPSEDLGSKFENEAIDVCAVPPELWDDFTQFPMITVPQLEILYLGMNCQRTPFQDVRVRQAISYALDPGAAVDTIFKGRAVKAASILPPGLACSQQRADLYGLNREKAIDLLNQAGYTESPRLTVELKSSESYTQQQFNHIYTEQLADIGVKLQVTYLDFGSLLHAVDTGNTQLFTLGWYADWPYPDQFLFLFHSSNWGPGGNGCFYVNDTVDSLLEEAAREPDTTQACQLYQKAEDIVLEDAVWVLQWRRVDGYSVQEWINGFSPGGMGHQYESLDRVYISEYRRQTTRIPQNVEGRSDQGSFYMKVGIICAIVLVAVVLIRLKRR